MTKGKRADSQTHGSPIGHHLLQFLHMSGTKTVVMTEDGWDDSDGVDRSNLPHTGDAVKRLPYSSCCKPICSIRVNTSRASCRCLSTSSNRCLEVSHKCQIVFDWLMRLC
jgi:hypothetical protein